VFVVVGERQHDAVLVLVEDVHPKFDEALGMEGAVFADLVAKGAIIPLPGGSRTSRNELKSVEPGCSGLGKS
jgi:hypothetical protein